MRLYEIDSGYDVSTLKVDTESLLMNLLADGVTKVDTAKVVNYLNQLGNTVTTDSIQSILHAIPNVVESNSEYITLGNDEATGSDENTKDDNADAVEKMAIDSAEKSINK